MMRKRSTARPKVVDLFSGVGGLSLGAARAGFNVALAVDNDAEAMSAHALNFPRTQHVLADLSSISTSDLLAKAQIDSNDIDGIIGGPPCQGFSCMGPRKADDVRNRLFIRFFEFVARISPKFFLAENVPGILHSTYNVIRDTAFSQINNYVLLEPIIVKASDYGVPTTRRRAIFFGYKRECFRNITADDFLPSTKTDIVTVGEALRGCPRQLRVSSDGSDEGWATVKPSQAKTAFWQRVCGMVPCGVGDGESLRRYKQQSSVSGFVGALHRPDVAARYGSLVHGEKDKVSKSVRLNPDGFCPTLRAGTGKNAGRRQAVRPIHPYEARVLSPREASRLQGFPDWFRFDVTKWHAYRQIGNSVSPILAEYLMCAVANRLIIN